MKLSITNVKRCVVCRFCYRPNISLRSHDWSTFFAKLKMQPIIYIQRFPIKREIPIARNLSDFHARRHFSSVGRWWGSSRQTYTPIIASGSIMYHPIGSPIPFADSPVVYGGTVFKHDESVCSATCCCSIGFSIVNIDCLSCRF